MLKTSLNVRKHLTRITLISIFIAAVLILSPLMTFAVTKTATTTGNWSTLTWNPVGVPASTDDVLIPNGITVTVNSSLTINSIHFSNANSGTITGTLTVNTPNVLTVTTGIFTPCDTIENLHKANATYSITGTGSIITAAVTIHDNTAPAASAQTLFTLTSTVAQLNITGNLTLNSTGNGAKHDDNIFNLQSGTVIVGGQIVMASSTPAIGSILMNGGAQSGTLILTGATPWSLSGTGTNTITLTGTSATVDYARPAGGQTIGGANAGLNAYTNLKLSNTSGTETAGAALTVGGTLTTTAGGLLDMTAAFTLGGTLSTITNNGTIKTSVPTLTSVTPIPSGKTWGGTGAVEYAGTTAQTVLIGTYNDLTFSGAGAKTTTAGTVTVNSNWSITSGTATLSTNNTNVTVTGNISGTGAITSGTGTITLGGNWTNSGTFTHGNGTVLLNGTSQQTISNAMTGGSAFYDLTITNASGVDDPGAGISFTPGIIFSNSVTATNNYTITTPSVRVQYNSGSTYTFNNINWNGGAVGTRIFFRNSTLGSGTWLLNVSGTQTAVSYVNVARSDASSGNAIQANDGTNVNSLYNTNWFFGMDSNFFLVM